VNRGLEKGEVKLRKSEIVRIIQEAIYERIKKDLPLDVPVVICEAISGYTGDIKKELEEKRKNSVMMQVLALTLSRTQAS